MLIRKTHMDLIKRIAWGFHKTTGIDYSELTAQAGYAYCKALQSYNPEKGKLKTWLCQCIKHSLINYTKEEKKFKCHVDLEYCFATQTTKFFFEFYDELTDDCKYVVDMILKDPYQYLATPAGLVQSLIKINLFRETNWLPRRITGTINQLKLILNKRL